MKILFLTDNFPPEVNAPATRTYEHCREWVKMGAEVTVITCFPNFPEGKIYNGYKNKWKAVEWIDGIKVIRVWSYITANEGFVKRTLDYISYAIRAFMAGLFIKTDLIIATSPQFFTALSGRNLAFWKRTPWIMEVRDLWPESIKTVGAMKDNWILRHFEWQERRCYKKAAKIVVVTDAFKKAIEAKGTNSEKIAVVKNGANMDLYNPLPKDVELLRELQLENKIVVGYIGTHGMAHKLDFILNCASKIENKDIHFILLGTGAEKKKLLEQHNEMKLPNVTMLNPVPKDQVKRYISILDISLINLKKSPLFHTVIPSKIFENAAMEIPILLGVEGESKGMIEQYNAGVCFDPENETDFLEKLTALVTDKALYQQCKKGGAQLAKDYDRKILAQRMYNEIEKSSKQN